MVLSRTQAITQCNQFILSQAKTQYNSIVHQIRYTSNNTPNTMQSVTNTRTARLWKGEGPLWLTGMRHLVLLAGALFHVCFVSSVRVKVFRQAYTYTYTHLFACTCSIYMSGQTSLYLTDNDTCCVCEG